MARRLCFFVLLISCCFALIPEPLSAIYGNQYNLTLHKCSFAFGKQSKLPIALEKSLDSAISYFEEEALSLGKKCEGLGDLAEYNIYVSYVEDTILAFKKQESFGREETCENEQYEMNITMDSMTIKANCTSGIIHALSTLYQLLIPGTAGDTFEIHNLPIRIKDGPRFSYRGLMIDSSRHFISPFIIKRIIHTMMLGKLNVLHWHLSDDDSFPMQSESYPGLAEDASHKGKIYKKAEILQIIEYAKGHGIRIIPEIDMPGHTRAIGLHAKLRDAIVCFNSSLSYRIKNLYRIQGGPPSAVMNPALEVTQTFSSNIIKDLLEMFPDNLVHLGGDEVRYSCWKNESSISEYMKKHNISDYNKLLSHFIHLVRSYLFKQDPHKKAVYWSNEATFKIQYEDGDVLQYWGDARDMNKLAEVYPKNYFILSPNDLLYLDCGLGNPYGGPSWCGDYKMWLGMYLFDPEDYKIPINQILGSEACAWGELMNDANLENRLWPRMGAFGETLWRPKRTAELDLVSLVGRLQEFARLLESRGVPVNPIVLGYCEVHTEECFRKIG